MIKSGSCGKNLTWTLDKDGTLTIKGTGEMKNYAGSDNPWNRLRVKIVVIQQGLTSIGKEAFRDCSGLTSRARKLFSGKQAGGHDRLLCR